MAGKKAKKDAAPVVPSTIAEEQNERLSLVKAGGVAVTNLFKLANEYEDLEIEVFDSGFPQLNRALVEKNPGVPRGRHIEVATAEPNVGKSTITAQIVAAGQRIGLQCALAEPEATQTESYLNSAGVVTRYDPSRPDIYPLRIMRPTWDLESDESVIYSAEQFLNAVGAACNLFDIVVVDSAAALCPGGDLVKDSDENARVAGISKLLHDFFRKHTRPKATVFWVNQLLDAVGKYSPQGTPKAAVGGKAIPFYSSIRLFGSRTSTIEAPGEEDPIGYWTEWVVKKNKCGPQDRRFRLPYIHGDCFSLTYALFKHAEKFGVIGKSGSWFQYPVGDLKKNPDLADMYGFLRVQGEINFYREFRERADTQEAVKHVLSGGKPEDLQAEEISEASETEAPASLLSDPAA